MLVGVIGAGALGLTAAYRLALAGRDVVVLEREEAPGGLAAGFRVGDAWLEKFYHHLFATDGDAIDLVRELGLGDRLYWRAAETSNFARGRVYPFNGVLPVLRYEPLPFLDRLRVGLGVAYLKLERRPERLAPFAAAEWVQRWLGGTAYRELWGPLLTAKFGEHAPEIAMPWLWARLHYRTIRLGYLRGGFQQLYDALTERIRARGGVVQFGTRVTRIASAPGGGARVETADGASHRFDVLLVTLPTRLFIQLCPELPQEYRERYGQEQAFGAHCFVLSLDRRLLARTYWLSIVDPGFPFLALVEHTNYLPPADYGGRHLVYLGNYLPMGHPLFRTDPAAALPEFLEALRRINPEFRPEWVREWWAFAAPYAQPIVTRGYAERIPSHTTPLDDVYLATMFQVYPQDRGQNYSIRLANQVAELILRRRPAAGDGVDGRATDQPAEESGEKLAPGR